MTNSGEFKEIWGKVGQHDLILTYAISVGAG